MKYVFTVLTIMVTLCFAADAVLAIDVPLGDFEYDPNRPDPNGLAPWSTTGSTVIPTELDLTQPPTAPGNASATSLFLQTGWVGSVWHDTGGVWQVLPETYVLGQTYTLSIDVINVDTSTGDGNLGFQMGIPSEIPGTFPQLNEAQAVIDVDPWTTYSRNIVANGTMAGQNITIRVFNVGHRNLEVDNIKVTIPAAVVVVEDGSNTVSEQGPTSINITYALNQEPGDDVTVTVDPAAAGQVDLGNGPGNPVDLTFDTGNWSTPQTVVVTAVDDAVNEGDHQDTLNASSVSNDNNFDNLTITAVTINIQDNEGNCGDAGQTYHEGDINEDCYVDIKDFAIVARDYLLCTDPQFPITCPQI
jgi:hypothetical protein